MDKFMKSFIPYHGPNDPCPPIGKKYYSTPRTYIWVFNQLIYPNSHQKKL